MFCYNCGCHLSDHDFCTSCGADVSRYKKIMYVSDRYYNEGLEKAEVRDLTGAVTSLRQSLKFNKNNIKARNLLGLVYFEMGEVVTALSEWVISKNLQPEKNVADEYIERIQSSSKLDTIKQTVKKYNRALSLCSQGSKDLAVIQLKKVLSLNPRFIRARQLLALLYMERAEWERAERELRKCLETDRNNIQTLRYFREVEQMFSPDEADRQAGRRKKEEAVRYQSENELIIQPLNVKEPGRSGTPTLLNMCVGLVIGLAVMYFLVVPAAQSVARNEEQDKIAGIINESDIKTSRIQELESQIAGLEKEVAERDLQIKGYEGEGGTLDTIDAMLRAAASYTETGDIHAAADDMDAISQTVRMDEMTEAFVKLYSAVMASIGPPLAEEYFREGSDLSKTGDYPAAIDNLELAVYYDDTHEEALYSLAEAYRLNGDKAEASATYKKVIERFSDTKRAEAAKEQVKRLEED